MQAGIIPDDPDEGKSPQGISGPLFRVIKKGTIIDVKKHFRHCPSLAAAGMEPGPEF
jgi:hypothetical protein